MKVMKCALLNSMIQRVWQGSSLVTALFAMAVLDGHPTTAWAAAISLPNASFESQLALPTYPYITTRIDSWQKAPRPDWFNEAAFGFSWDQTAGLFQNTPVGSPNHIDNMEGNQGLYFLAFPQVAVFQDNNTVDWNDPAPSHAFDATYRVGMSYNLTVGIIGGGGGMPEGATLQLGLYYRDDSQNVVMVGTTPVTYTALAFPTMTHFMDYTVTVPSVLAGDAWAGRNIGVQLLSTGGTGNGYWDFDNIRLTEVPEPTAAGLMVCGLGGFVLARRCKRSDRGRFPSAAGNMNQRRRELAVSSST